MPLATTLPKPNPWIEGNVTHKNLQRFAVISQQWKRSYIYATGPKRIVISANERPDLEEQMLGVVGPLGYTDMHAFLTAELATELH